MNKRSHLFVTEKIVKNLPEEKRSWVLHYVEDFYTLAHNFVFEGGLPSHILYERQLEDYLKEEAVFSEKENKPADICYIYKAVQAVCLPVVVSPKCFRINMKAERLIYLELPGLMRG